MSENARVHTFQWTIRNPFCRDKRFRRNFSLGSQANWSIELEQSPSDSRRRKDFVCHIKRPSDRYEITVERLKIIVILNEIEIYSIDILNYHFSRNAEYSFDFDAVIDDYDDTVGNSLKIIIEMKIEKGTYIRINDEERQVIYGDKKDVNKLVADLRNILNYPAYGFTRLYYEEDAFHSVHLYILRVRWTNFFKRNDIQDTGHLRIDISKVVLDIILIYMYTAKISNAPELWDNYTLVAQFFEILYLYNIFHMHGALSMYHPRISQHNIGYSHNRRISIELRYVKDNLTRHSIVFPIYVCSCAESIFVNDVHMFLFTVKMKYEKLAGPWLSYSISSDSEIQFNIHVSLEMPGNGNDTKLVHSCDYNFTGEIESGPILFLGCPETFFSHFQNSIDNSRKLLFSLTFQDGTSNTDIWYLSFPEGLLTPPISVLQDHMYEILTTKSEADLTVETRERDGSNEVTQHLIHKAIFASRVKSWWKVVEPNLPAQSALPDLVILPLCKRSFTRVVEYMYTGTMSYCPFQYRDGIIMFRINGTFPFLSHIFQYMDFPEEHVHV